MCITVPGAELGTTSVVLRAASRAIHLRRIQSAIFATDEIQDVNIKSKFLVEELEEFIIAIFARR